MDGFRSKEESLKDTLVPDCHLCVFDSDCMGSKQGRKAGVQAVLGRGPWCHLHTLGESKTGRLGWLC